MGIPFTETMGFLLTVTMGFLFTMSLGFQLTISKTEGLIVHHDQDGVYLGHGWLYELAVRDKVRISYSENGAKGNVHMESFNGRLKSENRLLFWEQDELASLKKVVDQRLRYYNHVRRHSALGNKSPIRYLKEKGKIPG